jgi:hypothetical protein
MTRTQAEAASVDTGLRQYMLGIYNYMALGVAFTAVISLAVAMNPAIMQAVAVGPMKWVLFIGLLGLGFLAPRIMMSGSVMAAQACFWGYAALWGALLSPIFYVYAQADIVRALFISAGAFAGMSLLGYTTKKNLSVMGGFLAMATFGILIALLVNVFFIQSSGFDLLLSIVVVLVFAGLTAYETQQIKGMYHEGDAADVAKRKSIFGAFMLYGSFITLFIWILHIIGIMRN